MSNVSRKTNYMVKVALLSAVSLILAFFEFPIFPAFSWLKVDPSDLPALIGAFAFGPVTGIVIEGFKNVLLFFFKGTHTGGVGELANFAIGAAFVGTAGLIYMKNRTRKTAIIALVIASLIMTVVAVPANKYLWIPLFKQFLPDINDQWVTNYLLTGVIPFNLIKSFGVSAITALIYKRVSVMINSESIKFNEKKETI